MTKGFLTIAQNTENIDYIRMAYALALSIKNSQEKYNSFCLATDIDEKDIPSKYKSVFDHIVPIPWKDHAINSVWKIENKWKYYYMTPYDETVVLDADMLFPKDISPWWDIMGKKDICITHCPKTYKNQDIISTRYRKCFVSNNLPNVYTAFMYFKKNEKTIELFKMCEIIFNNWEKFYYEFLDENRPKHLSGDVAYALAIKILGIENECFINSKSVPSFVHMKGLLQGIDEKLITEKWTDHIPTYFQNNGSFMIGNYNQTLPFHYHLKEWLTNDMIKILERNLGI